MFTIWVKNNYINGSLNKPNLIIIMKKKQTILITGSSRGIGAELAKLCKKSGFNIILHGKSKTKELLLLAKELDSEFVFFDVTKELEVKKAFINIQQLNIIVNSAGINISKPFEELEISDWKSIYNTNVFGIVNVIKSALPILKKNKSASKIINLASVKGTYSAVGRAAYASSKAAVINLTSSLAKEFSPEIIVNCVSPGFSSTQMTEKTWSERIRDQVDTILLKRVADPKEIAQVILFLCSEESSYITGQNITVDGGFGIKNV